MSESFPPADLSARMRALGLHEHDIDESFILAGGPGGQKLQKSSSCVQLRHLPSGLVVRCQNSRARDANRLQARELLCRKLEELAAAAKLEKQRVRALKRVEKRKPTPAEKRRRRESKQHRSNTKSNRRTPAE